MNRPPISPLDPMIYQNAKNQIDFISSNYNSLQIIESVQKAPILLITNDPKNKPLILRDDFESIKKINPNEEQTTRAGLKFDLSTQPKTETRGLSEKTNKPHSSKKRVRFGQDQVIDFEEKENALTNINLVELQEECSDETHIDTLKQLKSEENGTILGLTIKNNAPSATSLFEFAYTIVRNIYDKNDLKNGYFSPSSTAKGSKKRLDSKIVRHAIKLRFSYTDNELKVIWNSLATKLNNEIAKIV